MKRISLIKRLFGALVLFFCPFLVGAVDVGLVGVTSNKALLSFDGGGMVPVQVGNSLQGVRVISVDGDKVVVEIGGKRRSLRMGQNVSGSVETGGAPGKASSETQATLMADPSGHFISMGSINGVVVRFLVDTGATFVSLGASDARRIGIDTATGQRGMSQTANGLAQVTKVSLKSVQLGDIVMHNVDAMVHGSDMPIALLGMSFLNRMEMQRQGSTMTLKKRF